MPSLVERMKEVTVVAAFLFQSLASDSYPSSLVWEDTENLTCWLYCIHKKKKGYIPEVEKMFKDYILFKTRKSIANGQGKRSVLLQAIKASPYVNIVEDRSTSDKKFCIFTGKFKTLLNSLLPENDFGFGNREFENCMSSANGMDMSETPNQSDGVALETSALVPDVDMDDSREEGQPSFYPENGRPRYSSSQDSLLQNESVSLTSLQQFAPLPVFEQFAPLLPVFEEFVSLPVFEQPAALPVFEQPALLPGPQQSTILPMREEESWALYPPDYDPVEDLLHSQRASSHNSLNNHVNSSNKTQPSAFKIHDMHSVKLEGNRVHMLNDVGSASPTSPTYYMFSISPSEY